MFPAHVASVYLRFSFFRLAEISESKEEESSTQKEEDVSDEDGEEIVTVTEKPKDQWDCESILSKFCIRKMFYPRGWITFTVTSSYYPRGGGCSLYRVYKKNYTLGKSSPNFIY